MDISDFDYDLPESLIAQTPAHPRDSSRLMIVDRSTGKITHTYFYTLPNWLSDQDVLVFNNTKVFPARLYGKKDTGGNIEILLLKYENGVWEFIGKNIGRAKKLLFDAGLEAVILDKNRLSFNVNYEELMGILGKIGHTPLPPYIHQNDDLAKEYQTVYAKVVGSAAAPTAGLHFTDQLLETLRKQGVGMQEVTLHVGLGTFFSVKTDRIEDHVMHKETYSIDEHTKNNILDSKQEGKRILAVGTTSVRTLESWATMGKVSGETDIFIRPGYTFQIVDAMITNFHLPKSTLLMLVSAFAGRDLIMRAYQEAIQLGYRFFSFGDAMMIV